uniref:Uncharacterized protein n=1 Tax=Panagrolaimus superbus TaxID=310955 RepID=A0A914YGL7_9BILA
MDRKKSNLETQSDGNQKQRRRKKRNPEQTQDDPTTMDDEGGGGGGGITARNKNTKSKRKIGGTNTNFRNRHGATTIQTPTMQIPPSTTPQHGKNTPAPPQSQPATTPPNPSSTPIAGAAAAAAANIIYGKNVVTPEVEAAMADFVKNTMDGNFEDENFGDSVFGDGNIGDIRDLSN